MACTGALPPNANRGASFVHDPKLSRATETKGKIMLRYARVPCTTLATVAWKQTQNGTDFPTGDASKKDVRLLNILGSCHARKSSG